MLLVDTRDRLLLFRGHDPEQPDRSYWFTVGGGLNEGEDMRAAAVRETVEETGLRLAPDELVGPIHHDVVEFPFAGRWYRQEQDWFWAYVPEFEIDTSGFEQIEQDSVDAWRWWSVAELRATDERWYPPDLADLLERQLANRGEQSP